MKQQVKHQVENNVQSVVFTSLKGILDVIDLHLRARHSEDALMLQTYTHIHTIKL